MNEGLENQITEGDQVAEGMKSQIGGNQKKRRKKTEVETDNEVTGIRSKSYYLDVIFIQIVLLLLLYGVCVLVVPKLS
ncbi:hypothetical protein ACSAZK_06860 [Methanosarcina sp. Mfa9]|uniref:hypothetical protein n=1 Tax=Methanosarcina sp. Mfa9 TaxID=3439063 RepID=UPI003F8680BB